MFHLHPFNGAKLRKKLVKNNGFGKINAIRPKIKAKLGRTRKYENEGNAKFGGLVKELRVKSGKTTRKTMTVMTDDSFLNLRRKEILVLYIL